MVSHFISSFFRIFLFFSITFFRFVILFDLVLSVITVEFILFELASVFIGKCIVHLLVVYVQCAR